MTEKLEQFFEKLDNEQRPNWQRIFFLERANCGFRVGGWGFISNDNEGHQSGLFQEEALELMQASAFIFGMAEGLGIGSNDMSELINKYRDKYNAYFKAKS